MTTPSRAVAAAAVGAVGLSGLSLFAVAAPASAADPSGALGSVVINEVSSTGFAGGDFIELHNTSTTAVDLTGYHLKDNKALDLDDVVLDGKIAPQGYAVYYVDGGPGATPKPFGLGSADEATLLSPDGATVIDTYAWASHVTPSFARLPDGSGSFAASSAPTPGGPNTLTSTAEAQVTLNEVLTDGASTSAEGLHDYVEIYNGAASPVDLTGWYLTDGAGTPTAADRVTLGGASATLAAGGYLAVETELMDTEIPAGFSYLPASNGTKSGFGLSKTDWVFLHKPDGTLVSTTFKGLLPDEHAHTWSRLHPGTGLWKNGATPTPGAANAFPGGGGQVPPLDPHWADVEINEISSLNAADPGNPGLGDAVELKNTGAEPVSIEGWYQVDSGTAAAAVPLSLADLKVWNGSALVPASGWSIPAGGYVVLTSKKGLSGEGDAVKVYGPGADPATRQLVDEQAYGDGDGGVSDNYVSDSVAFAALPDGSDEFWRVTASTFGRDNTPSAPTRSRRLDTPVVVNEISNVDGLVELLNTGGSAVDISGWQLLDATGAVGYTVPASTTLPPGAFHVAHGVTGLGSQDSLTVRRASDQASVLAHTWFEDGIASYSRCDLFGDISYVETPNATWGAANACPSISTTAWPGPAEVATVDEVNGFGDGDGNGEGDASGAAFDPTDPDILWVVQNKNTLHKMRKVNGTYVAVDGWAGGKKLHFASGTGAVDSEGVTIGPDGSIYVTSERDNDNKSVSANKIERYDVSGVTAATTDLTAADEWDVNAFVTTGTNLGLEGITYVPDSYLVASGWTVDGAPYAAGTHPTPGLFVTAVEATGDLHFFSLAPGAAPVEVKVESSGLPFAMDVAFDADRQGLWALCDDSCGGISNLLRVQGGALAVTHSLARPAGMANLNNEGMAIRPSSTAVSGRVEVVWTDDGDTDGHSLREGHLPASFAVPAVVTPPVVTPPETTPATAAQLAVTKAAATVAATQQKVASLKTKVKAAKKAGQAAKAKRLTAKLKRLKHRLKKQKVALAHAIAAAKG
ncbi:lamin tail domain-containing protein [Nocardioides daeguensis]|uniref:LTD domain-containing protein n=1 Tax=Nocardioides daeguensis TaxID=908359 RepID=A0ABP6W9J0_9ACTN|nr:lamin tail domain-containing protein [Nocardioides daeguensis]MBV6729293.1 lamin tail domain-containing protein [Nocardioides daeguensis]MCR1774269.1 lamin tail domain-containing protein [Nocardioides daeguensis]